MRLSILLVLIAATPAGAQTDAPSCIATGHWSYAGAGRGTVMPVRDGSVVLDFTPTDGDREQPVFVLTVDPAKEAVFQINADFDVQHLDQDATLTLSGAKSAIPGRDFDVKFVKGDLGSSSFSRPIVTTGKPFSVALRTRGAATITARSVKLCFLHDR